MALSDFLDEHVQWGFKPKLIFKTNGGGKSAWWLRKIFNCGEVEVVPMAASQRCAYVMNQLHKCSITEI